MTIPDDVKAEAVKALHASWEQWPWDRGGVPTVEDDATAIFNAIAPVIERATIERCKAALSAAEYVAYKGAAIAILNALLPEGSA